MQSNIFSYVPTIQFVLEDPTVWMPLLKDDPPIEFHEDGRKVSTTIPKTWASNIHISEQGKK